MTIQYPKNFYSDPPTYLQLVETIHQTLLILLLPPGRSTIYLTIIKLY